MVAYLDPVWMGLFKDVSVKMNIVCVIQYEPTLTLHWWWNLHTCTWNNSQKSVGRTTYDNLFILQFYCNFKKKIDNFLKENNVKV